MLQDIKQIARTNLYPEPNSFGTVLLFYFYNSKCKMAWRSHGRSNLDLVKNLKGMCIYFILLLLFAFIS